MRIAHRIIVSVAAAGVATVTVIATATAQTGTAPAQLPSANQGGDIRGRLTSAGTGQAITGGSVTVTRGTTTSFAGGSLPRADGSFIVDGLPPGTYTLRVRALGYTPLLKTGVLLTAEQRSVDLGTLTLAPTVTTLSEQVVTAERNDVELAPERNSYAVKNMTSASGGTAVDALRNVPSVEVDGSNQISLRGNPNVVVQINGRTSPLRGEQLGNFLSQLPASTIARIEVATSPSAREDPEGTAGILNLVLAQQVQGGVSGGVSFGTGTTGLANLSGNIGRQSGAWTLFSSLSGMRDARPFTGESARQSFATDPAFANAQLVGSTQPLSSSFLGRSEYKFTERDALSLDALISRGNIERDNVSRFTDLDVAHDTLGQFVQSTDALSRNTTQDYTVAFRRTGPPRSTAFSNELRYTLLNIGYDNLRALAPIGSTASEPIVPERDGLHVRFPGWSLQSDLARPLSARGKLELGFRSTLRTLNSASDASLFDAGSGQYRPIAARTTSIIYREAIQALYGMMTQELGQAQAQLGLRVEETGTHLDLPFATQQFRDRYASLFPSGTLLYNLSAARQVKVSYSRRITRPVAPQLDPVTFYEDSRTAFRGNPYLRPEYTDAVELGVQEARAWGSIQLNPYLRNTANAVRNVRVVEEGVTVSTYENLANVRTVGTDLNVNARRGGLTAGGGGGVFDYRSDAGELSTHAIGWNARANVGYKLSSTLDGQVQANYRAPTKIEGGRQLAFFLTNFSLRRKLWGEDGSLTLRVTDPFNTAKFAVRTENDRVSELVERRFGQRGVFLTFSRNFGKPLKLRPRQDAEPAPDPTAAGRP